MELEYYIFDNLGHFELKMANILTQNLKLILLGTINMQYKIKALETLATTTVQWRHEPPRPFFSIHLTLISVTL